MQGYSKQVTQLVGQLVSVLNAEAHETARANIASDIFGVIGGAPKVKGKPGPKPKHQGSPSFQVAMGALKAPKAGAIAATSSGRRPPEDLERLVQVIRSHVLRNPGQRTEQIGEALGLSTKDLKLPMLKLVQSKEIWKKGERRGAMYYLKGYKAKPVKAAKPGKAAKPAKAVKPRTVKAKAAPEVAAN